MDGMDKERVSLRYKPVGSGTVGSLRKRWVDAFEAKTDAVPKAFRYRRGKR